MGFLELKSSQENLNDFFCIVTLSTDVCYLYLINYQRFIDEKNKLDVFPVNRLINLSLRPLA